MSALEVDVDEGWKVHVPATGNSIYVGVSGQGCEAGVEAGFRVNRSRLLGGVGVGAGVGKTLPILTPTRSRRLISVPDNYDRGCTNQSQNVARWAALKGRV